jgi:Flp pilus assembly protein TadD
MKNHVVAALTAALSFAACDAGVSPPSAQPPIAVRAAPLVPSDAGTPIALAPLAPVDTLALAHETSNVDHLDRAIDLLDDDDPKGALTEARRALFSRPMDPAVLELIGRVGRQAGQPRLSAAAWGRLAEQQPDDAIVAIKQTRALLHAKDYDAAVRAGVEATKRDSENPEAHQVTGLAHLAMNNLPPAIASFRRVLSLQPDHGYAMNNLGLAYLRANMNEEAVETLEEAAEHLSSVAYVHNNLGIAYQRLGRAEEARQAFQDAMDLSPKYVKARVNAARMARTSIENGELETESMSDIPQPVDPSLRSPEVSPPELK